MPVPQTMSGVLLTGYGGPDKLVWSDSIPVPSPGPGEALVKVLAAGVNNTDINTRQGWYAPSVKGGTGSGEVGEGGGWAGALVLPRIQGGDLCGRVVALGPGGEGPGVGARVTCPINQPEPVPGDPFHIRVIGSDYDGAFAQYCLVPVRHLHDVTDAPLTDIEVAAMPCAYGTALGLLTRAGVAPGQEVLITGASGGVGLAAVQLAAHLGATVTAIAAAAKADAVLTAGADRVLDRDEALPAAAFDAVIDVVGGTGWGGLLSTLRRGGHLAVAGAIAGPMVEIDLRTLYLNDLTLHGCTYQSPELFSRLVGLMRAGALRPVIADTYPLSSIAEAQAEFTLKRKPGKIVLVPPETAP